MNGICQKSMEINGITMFIPSTFLNVVPTFLAALLSLQALYSSHQPRIFMKKNPQFEFVSHISLHLDSSK